MNANNESHTGSCLRGAVRYVARGTPVQVNFCHCRMCQKATGAPLSAWATFPRDQVEFVGTASTFRRSSERAVRGFCAACGAALTWQVAEQPEMIDLSVGTLDDPGRIRPQDHLWMSSAVPWLRISDDLPRYARSRKG